MTNTVLLFEELLEARGLDGITLGKDRDEPGVQSDIATRLYINRAAIFQPNGPAITGGMAFLRHATEYIENQRAGTEPNADKEINFWRAVHAVADAAKFMDGDPFAQKANLAYVYKLLAPLAVAETIPDVFQGKEEMMSAEKRGNLLRVRFREMENVALKIITKKPAYPEKETRQFMEVWDKSVTSLYAIYPNIASCLVDTRFHRLKNSSGSTPPYIISKMEEIIRDLLRRFKAAAARAKLQAKLPGQQTADLRPKS